MQKAFIMIDNPKGLKKEVIEWTINMFCSFGNYYFLVTASTK